VDVWDVLNKKRVMPEAAGETNRAAAAAATDFLISHVLVL